MSSAILYLAIIAIWALVLIPRWLRRDSAHGAANPADPALSGQNAPDAPPDDGDYDQNAADDGIAPPGAGAPASDTGDARHQARVPLSTPESRRRMLAGRRRLLGMLVTLEAAAIALAVLRLAAIWVLIPPSIMLGGYLLLLREAAHADAERAAHEAAAAAARAKARSAARAAPAAPLITPAEGIPVKPAAATAAELAAKFAAAPVPADYEDSAPGRDFAPGLAGKYTTSYADGGHGTHGEDYDGYEPPRLRAVGD